MALTDYGPRDRSLKSRPVRFPEKGVYGTKDFKNQFEKTQLWRLNEQTVAPLYHIALHRVFDEMQRNGNELGVSEVYREQPSLATDARYHDRLIMIVNERMLFMDIQKTDISDSPDFEIPSLSSITLHGRTGTEEVHEFLEKIKQFVAKLDLDMLLRETLDNMRDLERGSLSDQAFSFYNDINVQAYYLGKSEDIADSKETPASKT